MNNLNCFIFSLSNSNRIVKFSNWIQLIEFMYLFILARNRTCLTYTQSTFLLQINHGEKACLVTVTVVQYK